MLTLLNCAKSFLQGLHPKYMGRKHYLIHRPLCHHVNRGAFAGRPQFGRVHMCQVAGLLAPLRSLQIWRKHEAVVTLGLIEADVSAKFCERYDR